MKVRVWQSYRCEGDSDWEVSCDEHDCLSVAYDWTCAMEAAWGHIAMHHPAPPCDHELGWYPASRPDLHKCLVCGAKLDTSGVAL